MFVTLALLKALSYVNSLTEKLRVLWVRSVMAIETILQSFAITGVLFISGLPASVIVLIRA